MFFYQFNAGLSKHFYQAISSIPKVASLIDFIYPISGLVRLYCRYNRSSAMTRASPALVKTGRKRQLIVRYTFPHKESLLRITTDLTPRAPIQRVLTFDLVSWIRVELLEEFLNGFLNFVFVFKLILF